MISKVLLDRLADLNAQLRGDSISSVFLKSIQTVNFRNFPAGGTINFESPVTAIVGRNGTGKSTVLYLAGSAFVPPSAARAGKTFNDFIPDSQKDKMDIGSIYGFIYGDGTDHRYIWHERKGGDPKRAGLREWDRRGDKTPRKQRNTVLLGFEKTISNPLVLSPYFNLSKAAIEKRLNSIGLQDEVTRLSDRQIEIISEICGKQYGSIEQRTDKHASLSEYCKGYIVDGQYSDIASGSGEISIIRIVDSITTAPGHSLILIDEPESGIHQVAQQRLLEFFVREAVQKGHQIIYTTHSQFMLDGLTPASIILLKQSETNRQVIPMSANRAVALQNIGEKVAPKFIAYVEDDFSQSLLAQILESQPATRELVKIEVSHTEGWKQMIKREFPQAFIAYKLAHNAARPLLVLDGDAETQIDKRTLEEQFGSKLKLRRHIEAHQLDKTISDLSRASGKCGTILFKSIFKRFSKGHNQDALVDVISEYVEYFLEHSIFFPGAEPPEVVICEWIQRQLSNPHSAVSQQISILPLDKRTEFMHELGNLLPTNYGERRDLSKARIEYLKNLQPPLLDYLLCSWSTDQNNLHLVADFVNLIAEKTS